MPEFLELSHTLYAIKQMQDMHWPQVVITGRSNVGKSSLINTLAGRKSLAKISSSPGKTRSVNFYWMPELEAYLVDLPGYGYAKRSKAERELWAKLIQAYFQANQEHILGAIVLIDSRLEPQSLDLEMVSGLKNRRMHILPVLTKVDKTKMGWRSKIQKTWNDLIRAERKPIFFSAKTGQGSRELLAGIRSLVTGD